MVAVEVTEAKMRVLKTDDLRHYSRAELWTLLRSISKAMPKARKNAAAARNARFNLRRIRRAMERDDLPPF
jgi:hypothetical protein